MNRNQKALGCSAVFPQTGHILNCIETETVQLAAYVEVITICSQHTIILSGQISDGGEV